MQIEKITYTIQEAIEVTGISRSSIYNLIAEDRLETRKIGRRTLIPARSLRRLLSLD